MVLDKKEMGDRILYFVQDETDSCELHALFYFNFLEVNDVVRVRNLRVSYLGSSKTSQKKLWV